MAYTDYLDAVQKMYIGYYQRPADSLGLIYWAAKLDAVGGNKNQIIAAFSTSAESQALYGTIDSTNIETVVDAIYTALFGRVADSAGKAYYVDGFNAGTFTPGTIVLNILDGASGEDKLSVDNKVTASNLFTETIDPNLDGRNFQATYSGDTDAAAARTWLADVGWNPVTVPIQSEVTAFLQTSIADASDPILTATSGETFTLTTAADIFTGTSSADTFNAPYTTVNGMTYQSSDALDGGAGTDTLNISVGAAGTYQAQSIKGIEQINATFTAGTAVSLLGVTGFTNLGLNGSTADAQFTNIGDATAAMRVSNTTSDADFSFTSAAVAGASDTANVTLSSVGAGTTLKINGATGNFETVALTSSDSANTIDALTTTNATKLTVAGNANLKITAGLDATIATVDASALVGGLTAVMGAVAAATVTGGSGNDALTVSAVTGIVKVDAGAGNDTVTIATNLATTDTLTGGDGTDTLSTTNVLTSTAAYTTPTTRTITGFETLKLTDAADAAFDTTDIDTGITKVIFALDGTNTSADVEFADGASTLEIGASTTTAASLTTAITVDALNATVLGGDSLTIVNKNLSTVNAFNGANVVSTDFESITINTGSYATAVAQTIGTISVTASSGYTKAETVNFAGANNITAGVITADIIDASAMTSTTGTTLTTVTGTTATTITGSAGNDILIADTTSNVSISGGAGKDTITGGAGNDVLQGDDGNDSITSGAGNDTISGGAGNDTIVMGASYATGDVIDGGDGTADVLSLTTAGATTIAGYSISAVTALNNALSNVERVTFSNAFDVGSAFDMARLDSISYITLVDGISGNEELSGLANGTTVVANADNAADTDILTLSLADSTGSADSLTYTMTQAATDDYGVLAVSGTETLNIVVNEATASTTVYVATLGLNITTATAGTTVNVSGTESVTIDTVIAAQTINATGLTSGAFIMTNTTGSGLSQTITTGAGADTVYGGGGADTIDSGAGADSIVGGSGVDVITGGDGADTIVGGAGSDSIILTETTAAVDHVVLDYSEAGLYVDAITGFTTTTTGDEIQLDLSALELAGTSGIHTVATNFQALDADTDAAAGAGTVQVLTSTSTTAAGAANVFVLRGMTFSDVGEVEDALETGGSFAMTVSTTDATIAVQDAFIVVYTDGTNAYVASARVVTDPSTNGVFAVGALDVNNLASISGVTTIGASTFAAGNFEWIA